MPDVVLVPVGGGGLISGIATAVRARQPKARIIAVEPERSAALHEALAAGRSVPVTPQSAADALSAPFAGERCVEICSRLGVESVLVSEDDLDRRVPLALRADEARLRARRRCFDGRSSLREGAGRGGPDRGRASSRAAT